MSRAARLATGLTGQQPLRQNVQYHAAAPCTMQLDIFNDSRDVMLRNDVLDALQRRDGAAAQQALLLLKAEYPQDAGLPAMEILIATLLNQDQAAFTDHAALWRSRLALQETVEPAACTLLGEAGARSWTRPAWRSLATRCAALPFDAQHAEDHAAVLWLRAGDAAAACTAAATIASWRRIPAPLGWMAEARVRAEGLGGAWPLLAELAWLAPARFAHVCHGLGDPALGRLLNAFDRGFDGQGEPDDWAWFPAWVLTQKPGLAPLLAPAQPSRATAPEAAMRLLVEILGLERQGRHHDLISHRRRLQGLHAGLYRDYMKPR